MAEMTAEKAVEWLTSDKAFGQECYSRKQIAALIEQQAAEIERLNDKTDAMRCCGNCTNHHHVINESKCFAGLPKDEWRFSQRAKFTSADSVCDKWKWIEKEAEVQNG